MATSQGCKPRLLLVILHVRLMDLIQYALLVQVDHCWTVPLAGNGAVHRSPLCVYMHECLSTP
jgi:hypothetical protein